MNIITICFGNAYLRNFIIVYRQQNVYQCNFDQSGELKKSTTYILFAGGFFIVLPETRQNLMKFVGF